MKRRAAVKGLAALLAAGAAGCTRRDEATRRGSADSLRPPETDHLRRHMDDAARTLDPLLNTDVYTQLVIDDLFEGSHGWMRPATCSPPSPVAGRRAPTA